MLVSAIMPTADRDAYAPLALDCFLRQTWTERELVVIDDGAESIAGLFAGVPLVRHTRFTVKSTVGEKACTSLIETLKSAIESPGQAIPRNLTKAITSSR